MYLKSIDVANQIGKFSPAKNPTRRPFPALANILQRVGSKDAVAVDEHVDLHG
jgi:hypothetical protein